MGKEVGGSDHEVYDMGPKVPNAAIPKTVEDLTPEALEQLLQLRKEFAESGAKIGAERYERAMRDGDIDSDVVVNESAARGDQTSYTIFDSETVVKALDAVQRNADAAAAAEADALWSVRREEMDAQGKLNAKGAALAREALGLPPKEADPLAGLSTGARRTLDAARIKGERARSEKAAADARPPRGWQQEELIQTPEQARQVGKKLADEQAQAKQAEEARGIIDKQAE